MRIGINGFGRIGRAVLRALHNQNRAGDFEVVAINDLTDLETLAYLLKNDSVYSKFAGTVKAEATTLVVNGKAIKIFATKDPAALPWGELGVDAVIESTGRFTDREDAGKHLLAGAKKVVISANSKDADLSVVMGVNHQLYNPLEHNVVANCSCTTNCAAPVMKILNDNFKVLKAQMVTVHAVTSTQNLVDGPNKNLRRARAAFASIIPQATGAAVAVTRAIPELEGRISAMAYRVPVLCGSVLEIVAQVEKETTVKKVNSVFKEAAEGGLKGILEVDDSDGLVSTDIVGTTASSVVDLPLTEVLDLPNVKDENLIKVVAWYDNEYAYAARLIDLVEYITTAT